MYLTLPNFVALRQKVYDVNAAEIFCFRKCRSQFTKFGEQVSIGQTPNTAKFRCAATRSVQDIRCRKFVLPQKRTKVHQK